eukprot:4197494-Amphidinium_carterae.1
MAPRDECLRRSGWSVVQIAPNGSVVRAAYGACGRHLCPQQTAPEAEDYALYMLSLLCNPARVGDLTVVSDCANTVRAAQKGPRSAWKRQARAELWRGIWEAFPTGLKVIKTKAHRNEAQLGEDAFDR